MGNKLKTFLFVKDWILYSLKKYSSKWLLHTRLVIIPEKILICLPAKRFRQQLQQFIAWLLAYVSCILWWAWKKILILAYCVLVNISLNTSFLQKKFIKCSKQVNRRIIFCISPKIMHKMLRVSRII